MQATADPNAGTDNLLQQIALQGNELVEEWRALQLLRAAGVTKAATGPQKQLALMDISQNASISEACLTSRDAYNAEPWADYIVRRNAQDPRH